LPLPKLLLLSLCLSSLLCFAQSAHWAIDQPNPLPQRDVQLVQTGTRSMHPQGLHIPLWAITAGDTTAAEQIAHQFNSCGPYGLNATLWTRTDHARGWVQTSYRRPKDADEAMALRQNPEPFTSRRHGDASILPSPFAELTPDMRDKIEFIIMYDDGTAKSYLYPGVSQQDAEEIVAFINTGIKHAPARAAR
jgi:hypothetical protein